MHTSLSRCFQLLCGCAVWLTGALTVQAQAPTPRALPAEQRESLVKRLEELQAELSDLSSESAVDAAIFAKGLRWGLDYDQEFTPADEKLLENAIVRCRQRIDAVKQGIAPWQGRKGKIALGYASHLDGSIQPYGVVIPKNYDPSKTIRLDIVLHGSQKPVGMNELRFISRFDEGDEKESEPPDQPFIELHPLGRVENCYRWAGEYDVIEALAEVVVRFKIDTDRIVLRGMSMGASGTWHIGLKNPDLFVALGPYCGYVDTHKFSETPLPNFVRVGPLAAHQELGLHMLDSVDYAANAGVVPVIAAMGEKDIFFDAHVIMGEAMKKEGLEMVNLISPGTGHVIDPVTHAEQMRRIGEIADRGIDHYPKSLRFVTWTLKYHRCHWLNVLKLDRHYHRAEISAKVEDDRVIIPEPTNIRRFSIREYGAKQPMRIQIGKAVLAIPEESRFDEVEFERHVGRWRIAKESSVATGKRPGLQGPIDDAFTDDLFLCVRGTGNPWNPAVHAYAEASLQRFAKEWRQYFRGDLPIKDDVDVTDDEMKYKDLILFGDGGSNLWINKLQPHLPITWSKDALKFGDEEFPSANHLPALIMPNPLPGGEDHYIVINSGHTFRGEDLGKLNYLLYPRWGDWALLKIDPNRKPTEPVTEEVLKAGYFDEEWKLP